MKKQFIGYPTVPTDDAGFFYRAAEADAKFKEYDDDNLALSQSVVKLGARIEDLEREITAITGQRDRTWAQLEEAREHIQRITFGSNK